MYSTISALRDEEEKKQWNDKKNAAATKAIESIIEKMQEDRFWVIMMTMKMLKKSMSIAKKSLKNAHTLHLP